MLHWRRPGRTCEMYLMRFRSLYWIMARLKMPSPPHCISNHQRRLKWHLWDYWPQTRCFQASLPAPPTPSLRPSYPPWQPPPLGSEDAPDGLIRSSWYKCHTGMLSYKALLCYDCLWWRTVQIVALLINYVRMLITWQIPCPQLPFLFEY